MPTVAPCYAVHVPDPRTHLFAVTLTLPEPLAQQELMLPVWIPGSYLVREFARHLQGLSATQGGHAVRVRQLDKHRWQVACRAGEPLQLQYEVYAHDDSVRTAWLDAQRAFFNPVCLCLRAEGLAHLPHILQVDAPDPAWQLATALDPLDVDAHGFGRYVAPDYDALADAPVEMGAFWSGSFAVGGVSHRLVVAGAPPAFDGARLLGDTQRIVESVVRFWHGAGREARPPFARYVFLLNVRYEGYGGLEHAASTALLCSRRSLPRLGVQPGADYTTLLGLVSHEYFHAWNVKRLRPAELLPYDYTRENHTELLWFFEGFTAYYDDLLLLRAGRIGLQAYLDLLAKAVQSVQGMPGAALQSVAQASFDAWTRYYRPDANTPNATVNYYTKGALVALCLDLTLRSESGGRASLDDVMRLLFRRHCAAAATKAGADIDGTASARASVGSAGATTHHTALPGMQAPAATPFIAHDSAVGVGNWVSDAAPARDSALAPHAVRGVTEADIAAALAEVGGRSYAPELRRWVHGTGALPVEALLRAQGVAVTRSDAPLAEQWGLRCTEGASIGVQSVLRGGAAEAAGLAPGDEWLAVQVGTAPPSADNAPAPPALDGAWRVGQLTDIEQLLPAASAKDPAIHAIVARDRRLLSLPFVRPRKPAQRWQLRPAVSSDPAREPTGDASSGAGTNGLVPDAAVGANANAGRSLAASAKGAAASRRAAAAPQTRGWPWS